jgi:uncharacterized protein YcfJ
MGLIGGSLGKIGGGALGGAIGKKYGGSTGQRIGNELGSVAGGALGALLPFKQGGRVTKKTQKALLHKGEIVVPAKYAKHVSKSLKDKIKKNGGHGM